MKRNRGNYQKEYYRKNREKALISVKIRKKRKYLWFKKLKKTLKCVDCGISDWRVLDFDHNNPNDKFMAISIMVKHNFTVEKILEEIKKCMVRCANCHRIKTFRRASRLTRGPYNPICCP